MTIDHALLSVDKGHRSYARGCRCRYCTKAHAAYQLEQRRAARRDQSPPVAAQSPIEGQLSLPLAEGAPATPDPAAAPILRSSGKSETLRHPGQARVGSHHRNPTPTELEAARSMVPKIGEQTLRYLQAIAGQGYHGLTDHEAAMLLELPLTSITGRRNELRPEYVVDSGRTRLGPYSKPNTVWIATSLGRRAIERAAKAAQR